MDDIIGSLLFCERCPHPLRDHATRCMIANCGCSVANHEIVHHNIASERNDYRKQFEGADK